MNDRPLCPSCNHRPVAINCRIGKKTYYRKVCDVCSRKGTKKRIPPPAWHLAGYTKKQVCEKCGFKAKYPEQLGVFYLDGNLKNNNWLNLKTVCLNCATEVNKSKLPWRAAPLKPDF